MKTFQDKKNSSLRLFSAIMAGPVTPVVQIFQFFCL